MIQSVTGLVICGNFFIFIRSVSTLVLAFCHFVPSVTEWIKAQDFDASAGGESPVQTPVRAATLCPYVGNGVRVCGRNRTEAREREWAEGTVSSLPGTSNVWIKFCHSTGITRLGGGVRASTTM